MIQIGALNVIYGPDGMPLEQYSFGTAAYYLHDWDDSTLGLVSGSGSIVASYTYDSYGNLTSSSGSESTPLRFQGQYQDPETGFYYLENRYYDPSTGQFLTPDPANSSIPYAFAGDDPTGATDSSGEMLLQAPGSSGTPAVAPPPAQASQQAAYYHELAKETAPAPAPEAKAPSTSSGDQGAVNALHTAAQVTSDAALGADTISFAAYGLALIPSPASPVFAAIGTGGAHHRDQPQCSQLHLEHRVRPHGPWQWLVHRLDMCGNSPRRNWRRRWLRL